MCGGGIQNDLLWLKETIVYASISQYDLQSKKLRAIPFKIPPLAVL